MRFLPFRRRSRSAGAEALPVPDPAPGASFRERVDAFWSWMAAHEERLFQSLQARAADGESWSRAIGTLGLEWELCPVEQEGQEGLALSGGGQLLPCVLARYAAGRAPALRRWRVFDAKQPHAGTGLSIDVGRGEDFAFSDFCFSVDFDQEAERLAVTAHHPRFSEIDADGRWQLTWIALDNALGERLVHAWLGEVAPTPERTPDQVHGIDALRRQCHAALRVFDLDAEADPLARFHLYERRAEHRGDGGRGDRSDIVTGLTRTMALSGGADHPEDVETFDRLAELGAPLAYLVLPADRLTPGDEAAHRGRIEDAVDGVLDGVGEVLGGATGRRWSYVDLVLFDERQARERLRGARASGVLPVETSLARLGSRQAREPRPLG